MQNTNVARLEEQNTNVARLLEQNTNVITISFRRLIPLEKDLGWGMASPKIGTRLVQG